MVTAKACVGCMLAAAVFGCSGECPTLQACDIRDADCQQDVTAVAACLRGGEAQTLDVKVVDADTLVSDSVEASSEATPEVDAFRQGLALFGLASPPGSETRVIREYWDTVGAFYSSTEDAITIVDRGRSLDGIGAVITLLHEAVHAMQYAGAGDFDAHRTTYDQALALSGMIEGEAVLYTDLATLDGYGRSRDVAWEAIFQQYQERSWEQARGATSLFDLAERHFPYAFGGGYMNDAWRAEGREAVREYVSNPLHSSRAVMAGYALSRGVPAAEPPNDVGKPVLPAAFEQIATRHFGAWLFELWRDRIAPRSPTGFSPFESALAGDVLTVFQSPADAVIVAYWRLRFDVPSDADAFAALVSDHDALRAMRIDRDVVVAAHSAGLVPDALFTGLVWEATTEEDWTAEPTTAASWADAVP